MTTKIKLITAITALQLIAPAIFAADKTYQVTGAVLEATANKIVVDKNGDRWELARDPSTKTKGTVPKVGDKVTIEYKMIATSIETKVGKKK
jgi:hypothetical protein